MTEFLLFIIGLILIVGLFKLLGRPLKFLIKIAFNTAIGGILLLLLNTFGSPWGISVGINWITAFVAGVLGLPGIVLLALINVIF